VRYRVTLERGTDGTYLAWVDDLLGCAVRASSREHVLERLPAEIRSFLAWSGSAVGPSSVEIEIVEEIESVIEADEDTEVLLRADRQRLERAEWDYIAGLLQRTRAELVDLLEALAESDLATTRDRSERTIRAEIEHIAFVELMYVAWTFDLHSKQGLRDFLAWTRQVAADRMEALAAERASSLTWASWSGAPRREAWTARKAARRLVWHELLHLRAIQDFGDRRGDLP
jgi:DinB superfamily